MMKAFAFILVFSALFYGCTDRAAGEQAVPSNILQKDTFVSVLLDFSLSESITNLNIKSVIAQQFDSVYAFNPLKRHNIRKSQFDSTVLYYSAHPKDYRTIYDTVLSHLNTFRLSRERARNPNQTK